MAGLGKALLSNDSIPNTTTEPSYYSKCIGMGIALEKSSSKSNL